MWRTPFLLILTLCACINPAGLHGGEVTVVEIDGVKHDVQPYLPSPGVWMAQNSDLMGGLIDPKDWVRNVRAIEMVSGCKVIAASAKHAGMHTTASVNCSE